MASTTKDSHLRQRLLRDVLELRRKPYPNIQVHIHNDRLTEFCLVLSPPGWREMHLTVTNLDKYPLGPPTIQMDSDIAHPNVFGSYICASILNTTEGYTPAYTLKGIFIQLLSFFGSGSVEQEGSRHVVSLEEYRRWSDKRAAWDDFRCPKCHFAANSPNRQIPGAVYADVPVVKTRTRRNRHPVPSGEVQRTASFAFLPPLDRASHVLHDVTYIENVPDEVLCAILEEVEEYEDLVSFARAWPRLSKLIADFNIMRQRDIQCFTLKRSYREVCLGVGVSHDPRKGLSSEFDLLSREAYWGLDIRESIHHIPFRWWLPLPLSHRHWRLVKADVYQTVDALKGRIKVPSPSRADVLFAFMTDIVVKLNLVEVPSNDTDAARSTLRHASEKAIESYFHLFHLLVCLATEDGNGIVRRANRLLLKFAAGRTSKQHCPNLGHLVVAMLISDVPVTEALTKAIITEAITRNVVWLLGERPELAFLETDAVSAYRLDNTFQGSRTSYRLLMFSQLFRRAARPDASEPLARVRDALFARHGAPPPGAAARLAAEVRRLHDVGDFPQFLREMGVASVPSAATFTAVLRQTLRASVAKGYSRWGIRQVDALALRMPRERNVGHPPAMHELRRRKVQVSRSSFFPEQEKSSGGQGSGWDQGGRRRR